MALLIGQDGLCVTFRERFDFTLQAGALFD
jgi:hypothetical protein